MWEKKTEIKVSFDKAFIDGKEFQREKEFHDTCQNQFADTHMLLNDAETRNSCSVPVKETSSQYCHMYLPSSVGSSDDAMYTVHLSHNSASQQEEEMIQRLALN